jgi:flagellin-specific chaperone FliS
MPVAITFRASASHGSHPFGKGGPAVDPYGVARLLMDGALERIEAAREHLVNGEQPERQSQLQSAVMIIGELRADLDLPAGGAIAANLDDLYDYMCRRLGCAACGARAFPEGMPRSDGEQANACARGASDRLLGAADLQNGIAALDEVSHLLDALQSAWTFMPAAARAVARN